MLPSAMSSSMDGALLIHSDGRCERTRHPSAIVSSRSDVGDTVGDLVEGRVPVDLRQRRLEQLVLVGRVARDDRRRRHDPYGHAFTASGVDVTSVLDRHLGVDCMHAADMRVVQAVAAAEKHLPQWPLLAHATPAFFAAWAWAASR